MTSLPDEAAAHADAIFLGPGEQTFPQFLADFRAGRPQRVYGRPSGRTLERVPPIRRDLIRRRRYLVPNSIVVTRGCPQHCDFCYKDAFFEGGRSFYTQRVDDALAEIARLPGPPSLLPRRSSARRPALRRGAVRRHARHGPAVSGRGDRRLDPARRSRSSAPRRRGCAASSSASRRSTPGNLASSNKRQNLGRDYAAVTERLHDLGIMINGSFVFGMDDDDEDVFRRTVDWAIEHGITTATFHIQTPYPGTRLFARMEARGPHR